MKKLYYSVSLILTIILFEMGCSHQQEADSLHLSVHKMKIHCWLNLMPGGSASFHISGEIKMKNDENQEITDLKLTTIKVFQSNKLMYSFTPQFSPKIKGEEFLIPAKSERDFLFSSKSRLSVSKNLNAEQPILIKLLFKGKEKSFLYQMENIKIEKVY